MLNKWRKLWMRDKSTSQWILERVTLKNQNVQRFLAIWGCCDRSFSCVHVFQTWFLVIRLEPTRRQFFSDFLDQSEASKMKSDQSQDRNLTASQPTNFQVELQQFLLCFHYLLPHSYSTVNGQNLNWLVIIPPNQLQKENIFWSKNITLFNPFKRFLDSLQKNFGLEVHFLICILIILKFITTYMQVWYY